MANEVNLWNRIEKMTITIPFVKLDTYIKLFKCNKKYL